MDFQIFKERYKCVDYEGKLDILVDLRFSIERYMMRQARGTLMTDLDLSNSEYMGFISTEYELLIDFLFEEIEKTDDFILRMNLLKALEKTKSPKFAIRLYRKYKENIFEQLHFLHHILFFMDNSYLELDSKECLELKRIVDDINQCVKSISNRRKL